MASSDPKIPSLKRKSANTLQTHLPLDLYQDDLDGSVWDNIKVDIFNAKALLKRELDKGFKPKNVEIGGSLELDTEKNLESYCLNGMATLIPAVENKLAQRAISDELLWAWGELIRLVSSYEILTKQVYEQRGKDAWNDGRTEIKNKAKIWYTFWFKHYKSTRAGHSGTRGDFNNRLRCILEEIRIGERTIPQYADAEEVLQMIEAMAKTPKSLDHFELTKGFEQGLTLADMRLIWETYTESDTQPHKPEDYLPIK